MEIREVTYVAIAVRIAVAMLLGGFIAYSIQAFANINVLQVAPMYYIIMGLILSQKH